MDLKKLTIGLLATSLLAFPAALAGYTGAGTFVAKNGSDTLLDNGGVICEGLTGSGVGGGCLPILPPDGTQREVFIQVNDDARGKAVAFQVCIDNNGDGICGGPQDASDKCPDQLFFSHADGGRFFNPLGPLPPTTLRGCDNAFQGYVVLICEGVHNDPFHGSHSHTVTTGTISFGLVGSGYGDFCGGGFGGPTGFVNAAAKAYRVV